jgi:predicted RNase H-like HicB family nuclease
MSTMSEIIEAVKKLPERDKSEFLARLAEVDFDDAWDRQIEADAKAGRLVWWSAEDNAFVVDVPELPSCMAHGNTRAEAIGNAEDAVVFWLQTAKEDGIAIPKPKGRLVVA